MGKPHGGGGRAAGSGLGDHDVAAAGRDDADGGAGLDEFAGGDDIEMLFGDAGGAGGMQGERAMPVWPTSAEVSGAAV
jgi:hypothetical protein